MIAAINTTVPEWDSGKLIVTIHYNAEYTAFEHALR